MDFVVCGQSNNEYVLGEHMLLLDIVYVDLLLDFALNILYIYEHMLLVVVRDSSSPIIPSPKNRSATKSN